MKKTIARTLMILGMISALGATTNLAEQEQMDFREMFGSRQPIEQTTSIGPSKTGFTVGTALEFAISGGLLSAAAAVNGRAGQGMRLDSERPIKLNLKQNWESSVITRSVNNSNRGLGTLISYLSDSPATKGQISQVNVNAIENSGEVTIFTRVVIDNSDNNTTDLLFESIFELIHHKMDRAQELVREDGQSFEESFAKAVSDEIKLGPQVLIKTLKGLKLAPTGRG